MNCSACERRLEQYEAGTLAEADRLETDRHLRKCAACRALLEALEAGQHQVIPFDLSEAVLSRTTGSACTRCRSLLGDFVDGFLDGIESELVLSHVGSCVSCNSLFRTMSQMAEVLPGMRELTPDSSFVADVLRSTRALRPAGPRLPRILDFFRGLAQRPRFSWEAAYLATLLVFGLFGTPFSPAHDASSRLLASLQNREGLVAQADSSIERWQQEAQTLVSASGRTRQTISRMLTRSAEAADQMVGEGQELVRQSEDFLKSAGKTVQERIAAVYQQAKGAKALPQR